MHVRIDEPREDVLAFRVDKRRILRRIQPPPDARDGFVFAENVRDVIRIGSDDPSVLDEE